LLSNSTAVSWGGNHIDVFTKGSDYTVTWTSYNSGVWSWSGLAGIVPSGSTASASSVGEGRLDIFTPGTNGYLYTKTYINNSWSLNWVSIGKSLSNVTPSSTYSGVLNVITIGSGNTLSRIWLNGSTWTQWTNIATIP
jgi:hypothetical protein